MDVAVEVEAFVELLRGGSDCPANGDVVPVVKLSQALPTSMQYPSGG